jgi:hypothetical protein
MNLGYIDVWERRERAQTGVNEASFKPFLDLRPAGFALARRRRCKDV